MNVFSAVLRIGIDAEVRKTSSGQSVVNFTAACNVGYGEREQTLWFRVSLWGKRAEGRLPEFLKKGTQVFVSGELSQSEYQARDGATKTSMEINANVVDLVGSKNESQTGTQQPQQNNKTQQQPQPQPKAIHPQNQTANGGYAEFDDDTPFDSMNWQIRAHII
jgi:single-strand DNA-binding protein